MKKSEIALAAGALISVATACVAASNANNPAKTAHKPQIKPATVVVPPLKSATISEFVDQRCLSCHDQETKEGGLDLTSLKYDLGDAREFAIWVKVHDRVRDGEMPPPKKKQPTPQERAAFKNQVARALIDTESAQLSAHGRAIWRRLNRYEYENTVRDLLGAPWLQLKDMLPEDGEAHRFNKVGEALDVSHVQMSRYLQAAD